MDYTAEDEKIIEERWEDLLRSCTKICRKDEDWDFIKRAFFLAKEAHAGVRRRSGEPLSAAPDRRGENRHRGDRTGSQIGRRIAAARRGGRHRIHGRRHGAHLRPEDRLDGRRTDQDVGRLQRRHVGAGRIFPQGAAHALGRRAGNPHQDRRPAAQHAHAGRHAPEQADQDHQRDDLPLRAAGVQTGAFRHQNRTGRPLHEVPFSGAVRGDQPQTGRDGGVAPGVHRTLQRSDRRSAAARRHQFRDFGPCQEHLLDLDEDAAQTDSFRRGLRSVRHPHRLQTAALPVGKDAVLPDLCYDHGHLHCPSPTACATGSTPRKPTVTRRCTRR